MSLPDADLAALHWARTHLHSPRADRAVAAFSKLGEHGAGWIALGVLGGGLDRRRRARWLRGAKVVAVAYAANQVLKLLVRRQRPELVGLPPLTSTVSRLSFPSAHATTSFAGARAYGDLVHAAPLYTVGTLIGLSRLYLGVHYPSDVIAGALLGSAIASAAKR